MFARRCYPEDATVMRRDETVITLFFRAKKLIAMDVLPKEVEFNQLYFVH
jgi:hypothetical protein